LRFAMDEHLKFQLEMLIDQYTLTDVLNALVSICGEKADHIRSSYQDKGLAKIWENMGRLIGLSALKCDL
jgi:hypothetical protein